MIRRFSARSVLLLIFVLISLFWIASFQEEESFELTSNECKNPGNEMRSKCCQLGQNQISDTILKCAHLKRDILPKEGEKNCAIVTKFLTCLMECTFQQMGYIDENGIIDLNSIKLDINSQYSGDAAKNHYLIKKYKFCIREATTEWEKVKDHFWIKFIFRMGCNPFYMVLHACLHSYGKNTKWFCHYDVWEGEDSDKDFCKEMSSNCDDFDD